VEHTLARWITSRCAVEMLGVQERIATRFAHGLHRGGHLVDDDTIATAIARHTHLSDEQQRLVRSWCGDGRRHQAAIGRAGAGYRVVGTAVKGEAARTLAAATGIECETVAWYLAHDDPQALPRNCRNPTLRRQRGPLPFPEKGL
jgi:hypothetical protein